MKLNDWKIETKLRLSVGFILALVAILAALAWKQTRSLWLQTKGLYDHPHQVRRAIDELTNEIQSINLGMRDMVQAASELERRALQQNIDIKEANAYRLFNIMNDRYLGPETDLTNTRDALVKWKTIRDETFRLLRAGSTSEAAELSSSRGAGGRQMEKLWQQVMIISDFAKKKGDRFYHDAEAQKNSLNHSLAMIVAIIFMLLLIIARLLLKSIKTPLADLTAATEQFEQGHLEARSRYVSVNEFGMLAASFNSMAATIQTEMLVSAHAADLSAVMLREEEVHVFCSELLKALLKHTGSQVGAVYFLNDAKTDFEHFESIGLGNSGRSAFSATQFEGELGVTLAARRILRITDIPSDTRFTFSAVSGEFKPKEIVTIPILSDHEVAAMISLASFRSYDEPSVRLLDTIWGVLTARMNGVLAFRKLKDLAERLEHQNHELEVQKQELAVQKDELNEQNIELGMQKREVDEANRLKSAFLSNMSHELRTPLNSVIALAGVLNRRLRGSMPEEEYGYLEVIERNGRNLLALINDILDLSRIEAGREEISISDFSLNELAAEVVSMIEPQAKEKGIGLVSHIPVALPALKSDLSKCRHILQNLVGNAVKFTEKGRVEISAAATADGLQITVTDSGVGIAPERIGCIFDEFRQADETMAKKYGGTGLGLSIAKKYATLLQGNIVVESKPGYGSTFTLWLPLAIEAPGTAEPAAARPGGGPDKTVGRPAVPPSGGKCILLVEDNEPTVIQMLDILAGQGYRVQVAHNGREALEQIKKDLPDAMILDLMMPEVDGFEVLKKVRGMKKTAHLPVLILTAKHVTREELAFLKGNHIRQLIQKGDINREDLLVAIESMVSPPRSQQPPPRTWTCAKPLILIVEDNPDSLLTARSLLKDRYRVIEAEDGRAGVEQAKAQAPDLILMDLSLPVMDGFEALAAIRSEDALRQIPVIALTASAMKGDREEVLARGFDGYISKPIEIEALESLIEEKLDENR